MAIPSGPLLTAMAPIITGVGQCVVDALGVAWGGLPSAFRSCLLIPTNQIAWDGCSCDGQFGQAITARGAAVKFPTLDTGSTWMNCGPPLDVALITTSLARCVPAIDARGNPPSCADELAAALRVEADRETIRRALACCLSALKAPRAAGLPAIINFYVGPSVLVGDTGGCVAIETPYAVALGSCLCP